MFSKSRIHEPGPRQQGEANTEQGGNLAQTATQQDTDQSERSSAEKAKSPASMISSDLTITGNLETAGDIQVEGTIEGDIRAHLLTVGESAMIKGEIVADDVVVNGRVTGRLRGLKVRLSSSARVEGDIIHKTIAIESGAHFEGSVQRQENPVEESQGARRGGGSGSAPTASGGGGGSQPGRGEDQQKAKPGAAAAAAARQRPTPTPQS